MTYPSTTAQANNAAFDVSADNWNAVAIGVKNNTYTYSIYKSGSTYYAKNGLTGQNDYNDADLYVVLNAACVAAAAVSGTVFLTPGTYTMETHHDAHLSITANTTLAGESAESTIIETKNNVIIEPKSNTIIQNLQITCNGYAGMMPVYIEKADSVKVRNCILKGYGAENQAGGSAFEVRGSTNITIDRNEISGGGHNGIYVCDSTVGGTFHCSDIIITGNYIHDNYDDAIDVNDTDYCLIKNNRIEDNEFCCLSCEGTNTDIEFSANTVLNGQFIYLSGASRVSIKSNTFDLPAPNSSVQIWTGVSDVVFIGNDYGSRGSIYVAGSSKEVTITYNHFKNNVYGAAVFNIANSTGIYINYNTITSWSTRSEYNLPFISSGTTDDYTFIGNILENFDACKATFVGSRYIVKGNIYTRQGSTMSALQFNDYSTTMTGVAGTAFTFEAQKGTVANIDTSSTAVVTGTITFPIQYPTGKVPQVYLTLKAVAAGVVIDTIQLTAITVTTASYSINVAAGSAETTCSLQWISTLTTIP